MGALWHQLDDVQCEFNATNAKLKRKSLKSCVCVKMWSVCCTVVIASKLGWGFKGPAFGVLENEVNGFTMAETDVLHDPRNKYGSRKHVRVGEDSVLFFRNIGGCLLTRPVCLS